jgi:serine phosphatase RsbU (regulator of sigma subunit)/anti-sigma regulatory factor (Ser/Thr protein kinase)/TolA-binding protein
LFKNVIKEQLKVPAHFDYLGELRDFVTRIGRKHGVNDKIINAFKLSIDEAGSNVIRHAYREFDEPGFILLRVVVRKASITVNLIDQGKYFDPRFVKNPDLQRYVDIGKKGGLGIFIIRKLMDEIDYRKTEEGNELRLTKYLEAEKRTRKLPAKVASVPLTLKAKYFIRIAAIVTVIILTGYFYYYINASSTVHSVILDDLHDFGERIDSLLVNEPTVPFDKNDTYSLVRKIHQDNVNKIYEIVVTDNSGKIQGYIRGSHDTDKWLEQFEPASNLKQIREKIFKCTLQEFPPGQEASEIEVYDYISTLVDKESQAKKGELHIRRLRSDADYAIAGKRWEDLKLTLIFLLASYAGISIMIYVLLNPFRKLSDWVRAMDHGDEVEDEMDIDSSTEIGEIAKAFSEITSKFRESQKNLVAQEQLQKEMQVAQEIQKTLLPTDFPNLEGYELSSLYQAAKEVGGDYYDFVEVDKDTLGIVVADVSGKGVPGSLVMTMIRTALRTEARGMYDAAEVLARVNDFVVNDMKKGMFVTIFYVIIDSKRRRLNYASAGHNPMILYRPSAKKTYYLNPKGFPIGIQLAETDLFRNSIESDTILLAEDDILILYTDGITEAMNGNRDLFGEERFLKVIREHGSLRVKPFVEKLQLEIESFTEGAVQYDDITLVSIKEKTSQEKEELRRAKLAHIAILEGQNIRDACEEAGITTYAYYNKYKKQFEEHGIENYEIDEDVSVEAKHISIEDKTKIFDIIKNHPEFGAKRIAEELNSQKYDYTNISENKIYDELVRSRLNTRQLREAFIARGDRNRRRMKPPGTPMLTLDGRVIIDRTAQEVHYKEPLAPEKAEEKKQPEKSTDLQPSPIEIKELETTEDTDLDMEIISTPVDDLLDKRKETSEEDVADFFVSDTKSGKFMPDETAGDRKDAELEAEEIQTLLKSDEQSQDFAFEELIEDELQTDDKIGHSEKYTESAGTEEGLLANESQVNKSSSEFDDENLTPEVSEESENAEDDFAFTAFEDLLKMEISNSFEMVASNVVVDEPDEEVESVEEAPTTPDPEETDESHPANSEDVDNENEEDFEEELEVDNTPSEEQIVEEYKSDSAMLPVLGDDTIEILTGVGSNKDELNGDSMSESDVESSGNKLYNLPSSPRAQKPLSKENTHFTGMRTDDFTKRTSMIPNLDDLLFKKQPEKKSDDNQDISEENNEGVFSPGEIENTQRYGGKEKEQILIAGLRYYKKHEFDRAIAQFEDAIEQFPDFKEAHSILGNAYFRKDQYQEASKAYHRVLELDPADATAHENMGVIFANQGHLDKAIEQWENVIKIDPDRSDILKKIEKAWQLLDENQIISK